MKNTLAQMMIATSLYVIAQVTMAHPVIEYDPMQDQALIDACLSDYVLDWEDEKCDFLRPEGDIEVAKVVIIYSPATGTAEPVVIIGDDDD